MSNKSCPCGSICNCRYVFKYIKIYYYLWYIFYDNVRFTDLQLGVWGLKLNPQLYLGLHGPVIWRPWCLFLYLVGSLAYLEWGLEDWETLLCIACNAEDKVQKIGILKVQGNALLFVNICTISWEPVGFHINWVNQW